MAHPYNHLKEKNPGKKRASEMIKHFKRGGSVHSDEAADRSLIKKMVKKEDLRASGGAVSSRLDKRARGGGVNKKKGHHTHINIMVAPKGGDTAPPPVAAPPPAGAMPMAPKAPMGPPPGGPMGGGPVPGMPPKPPGVMARGGKAMSGISNKENLKSWAEYASKNIRYESGGKVPMKAGAITGEGRLEKIRAYGKNAKKG